MISCGGQVSRSFFTVNMYEPYEIAVSSDSASPNS